MTQQPKKLRTVGIIGTLVAALCCFTPVLVIGATIIGVGGVALWLDYVLIPILLVFLGITIYSFVPKK